MDVENDEVNIHFETARTAAFSDAVLAIAITLLVLDLKPPSLSAGQTLGAALAAQWPRYIALVSSFALIGLIWIHHHRLFRFLERADHTLLNLNLLLMLAVLIVPFPTALLAEYPYERVAAVLWTNTTGAPRSPDSAHPLRRARYRGRELMRHIRITLPCRPSANAACRRQSRQFPLRPGEARSPTASRTSGTKCPVVIARPTIEPIHEIEWK